MLNGFHSHPNAEHPADPIKLVAELAAFLTGLQAAQRIYGRTLTYIPSEKTKANEDQEETRRKTL